MRPAWKLDRRQAQREEARRHKKDSRTPFATIQRLQVERARGKEREGKQ